MTSQNSLSWVHFGDLHIRGAQDENYLDFLELIKDANRNLAGNVDFAFLPGDNADDGSEAEYELIRKALNDLAMPVHIITGDHDRKAGALDLFRQYLEPDLFRAVSLRGFLLLFLNAMDGRKAKEFDFGPEQMQWMEGQLRVTRSARFRPIVFTHLYPSELVTQAEKFSRLLREFQVELVEMGHTHYNELANDGRTIYAATRSTGQIEEGPPGFSLTVVDGDVVSWKFKERGPWPFVMITSPADERLITRPESASQVVRGSTAIRAKVWGDVSVPGVTFSIDGSARQKMNLANGSWEIEWNSSEVPDGTHRISVRATGDNSEAEDEISVVVSQSGYYTPPQRSVVDYENTIGAYPGKCLLGTQLGPNENGTKGPWPSWRGK